MLDLTILADLLAALRDATADFNRTADRAEARLAELREEVEALEPGETGTIPVYQRIREEAFDVQDGVAYAWARVIEARQAISDLIEGHIGVRVERHPEEGAL